MIKLRSMTFDEFASYEEANAHRYAEAMVGAGFWPSEGALERAYAEHARLLSQGLETPDHFFFIVETPAEHRSLGVLWLSVDRSSSPPSGFIYDLFIEEAFRGKGFGKQAMLALEEKASELGLTSLGLHVFATNERARKLYSQLGYEVQSMNMSKKLIQKHDQEE